jgi:NTE family protein
VFGRRAKASEEVDGPLASPALGTATGELVGRCEAERPARGRLPTPPREPAVAVALSGGGFRASLAGLGVLRFLADAGLLDQVRHVSSVSGGSVAAGLWARHYAAVQTGGFTREALDEHVVSPFVRTVARRSLSRAMLPQAYKLIGRWNRTDLLASELDRWLFDGMALRELPAQCRFMINAANTTTSVRFVFERDMLGDYVIGYLPTRKSRVRLAQAVAASAAVPGLLAPMTLDRDLEFPCQRGRTVRLVDGGAYDNSGLEAVDALTESLLVAINAGGLFVTGQYGRVPLVRDLQLAQSLLYRQSTALRRRWTVERFKAWEAAQANGRTIPDWGRRGVLFGLATTLDTSEEWARANARPPDPQVAYIKTSFDRFPAELCSRLIYAGWWLTGATLSRYHREVLPDTLPTWTPV